VAGLTPQGFEAKPLDQIKSEIEADERGLISPTINTSTDSVVGQLNGIFSTQLRQTWELLQALYEAVFTDSAEDYALTLRAALTGTLRRPATFSRVETVVNVNPGTYPAGTLIASVLGSPDDKFTNESDVENPGMVAANVTTIFVAIESGPVRANAGTLTVIAQAVTGWNSVNNPADANLGALQEGDAALRLRREAELRALGSTNVDAIRADLLRDVEGVIGVGILENDTNTTDVNGVPGHSIECLVHGPLPPSAADDQAVAEKVWGSKAAGIGTYGTTTKTVTDSQGIDHEVRFTRPTELDAYADFTLVVDADTFAGIVAVKEAVAAVAEGLGPGERLDWRRVVGVPYSVPGVVQVTAFGLSTNPGGPFTEADVVPTVRQIVVMETSSVTVTVA
jgi:uncharacterized phage protein gp47/JayE